jgi:hypothetical protein
MRLPEIRLGTSANAIFARRTAGEDVLALFKQIDPLCCTCMVERLPKRQPDPAGEGGAAELVVE